MKTYKVTKQIEKPQPVTTEEEFEGDFYEINATGDLTISTNIGDSEYTEQIASFAAGKWTEIIKIKKSER